MGKNTLKVKKGEELGNKELTNRALLVLKYCKEIDNMTYKDLGDYLIYTFCDKQNFFSKDACVLDAVVQILFDLQDTIDINKDLNVKSKTKN